MAEVSIGCRRAVNVFDWPIPDRSRVEGAKRKLRSHYWYRTKLTRREARRALAWDLSPSKPGQTSSQTTETARKQHDDVVPGEPARYCALTRAAVFNHLAAVRLMTIDLTYQLLVAACRRLQLTCTCMVRARTAVPYHTCSLRGVITVC